MYIIHANFYYVIFFSFSLESQTSEQELFLDTKIFEKGLFLFIYFGFWKSYILYIIEINGELVFLSQLCIVLDIFKYH